MDEFQRGFSREPLTYPAAMYGIRQWTMRWVGDEPAGQYTGRWALPEKLARCCKTEWFVNAAGQPIWRAAAGVVPCKTTPNPTCACGIYAYFSPHASSGPPYGANSAVITGVVEASGTTIVGELGFKTAHAKVLAITAEPAIPIGGPSHLATALWGPHLEWVPPSLASVNLGKRWGVPVFDDREAMLREFPLTDLARDFPALVTSGGGGQ